LLEGDARGFAAEIKRRRGKRIALSDWRFLRHRNGYSQQKLPDTRSCTASKHCSPNVAFRSHITAIIGRTRDPDVIVGHFTLHIFPVALPFLREG
jgi:hypothetical protein